LAKVRLKIKEKIDFSFVEEETKDLYSSAVGRPSFPSRKAIFLFLFSNSNLTFANRKN